MLRITLLTLLITATSLLRAADPATPPQIHQTVDRAIKYQQAECTKWLSTRKCAACHHAPLVLWSLNEATRYGYTGDQKFLTDTPESRVCREMPSLKDIHSLKSN